MGESKNKKEGVGQGLSVGKKEMLSLSSGEQGVFEINKWEQGISLFISGKN